MLCSADRTSNLGRHDPPLFPDRMFSHRPAPRVRVIGVPAESAALRHPTIVGAAFLPPRWAHTLNSWIFSSFPSEHQPGGEAEFLREVNS